MWYYEHVQEITANNCFDHPRPLMSKWTREKMERRDDYERRHGRFHGNIIQQLTISEVEGDHNSFPDEVQVTISFLIMRKIG